MRLSDIFKFDPDQPRDDDGRWTSHGGEAAVAYGRGQWVPGYEGRVKNYRRPGNDNDGKEQAKWLDRQARDHGYDTLDMMAEMDAHLFNRLAAKWRKDQKELALRDEKRTLQVFKFDPDQPRDERGRWVAVNLGKGEFGLERVTEVNENGREKVISLGLAPNTFHSKDQAQRAASARNKQKNLNAITSLAVEMRRRKERGLPFSSDDQQSYYESRTAKEEALFGEIFKGGGS